MNAYFTQLSLAEKKPVAQRSKKDTEHVSLEKYNKDIDEAMAEVARGESYSHKEVVKMSKNW